MQDDDLTGTDALLVIFNIWILKYLEMFKFGALASTYELHKFMNKNTKQPHLK